MNAPSNSPSHYPLLAAGMEKLSELRFDNRFARLPEPFYTRLAPSPLPDPYLVHANPEMAAAIGLDPAALASEAFVQIFAGNHPLSGADPLAAVYSGHQFGVWAGQLGDGRAILLGEVEHQGARWELQLKGSGRTPYSRMGDGRAVLRSSIREYLCAEAMHHLGIPTTRSLALVGSDHPVVRETVETAAICTRVSPTFVRFGSFEHWFYRNQTAELRSLADHVIDAFLPACREARHPYLALLEEAVRSTARLIAQWQAVGFCHGVMNTDNMSILGLTLDYGPFGFMEAFDPGYICNHSDEAGRYAYGMQPSIAHWNLFCLGQALLPLLPGVEEAEAVLSGYEAEFNQTLDGHLHRKLGLRQNLEHDQALMESMFRIMHANRVDFTALFRALAQVRAEDDAGDAAARDLFIDRPAFDAWVRDYRDRLRQESASDAERAQQMNRSNPRYVLRNHLAEIAIRQARDARDFSEIDRLFRILQRPYDDQPEHAAYAALPPEWAGGLQVSCSS